MPRRKTHQEYVAEVAKVHPDFKVLSFYIDSKTKVKHQCKEGHEWWATPSSVLYGTGCPKCAIIHTHNLLKTSLEELKERVRIISKGLIEYVSGFDGMLAKCVWRCVLCNHKWKARPNSILHGTGCPKCAIKRTHELQRMTLNELKQRIELLFNGVIEYVSGFVNYRTKCLFRCKKCNHEWWTAPSTILRTSGCPVCLKKSLEKPVLEALKKKGIKLLHNISLEGSNYKESKVPLRVDFIIETDKGKLAIETDGVHHFNPFYGKEDVLKLQQEHDRYKDKLLKERGYILIRVTSSPTKKWGFKNHITLSELLYLIETGINSETGEIDFELFRKYDFNRE